MGGGIISPWPGEFGGGGGGDYDSSLVFLKNSQAGGTQESRQVRKPKLLKTIDSGMLVECIAFDGEIFIIADRGTMKTYSMRKSGDFVHVSTISLPAEFENPFGLQVQGSWAYLASIESLSSKLSFIRMNIDDPGNLIFSDGIFINDIRSFVVSGKYAFIAAINPSRIEIIDIRSMSLVGVYEPAPEEENITRITEIVSQGKYLICLVRKSTSPAEYPDVIIIDRSDITNLQVSGRLTITRTNAATTRGFAVHGGLVAVSGTDVITFCDISKKNNPVEISNGYFEQAGIGEIRRMTFVDQNYLIFSVSDFYVPENNKFGMLDIKDITVPIIVGGLIESPGWTTDEELAVRYVLDMKMQGNIILTAARNSHHLSSWSVGGYFLDSLDVGSLNVRNKATFFSDITATGAVESKKDIIGLRGYFQQLQNKAYLGAAVRNSSTETEILNVGEYKTLFGNLNGYESDSIIAQTHIKYVDRTSPGPFRVGETITTLSGGSGIVIFNDDSAGRLILSLTSGSFRSGMHIYGSELGTQALIAFGLSVPPVYTEFKFLNEEKVVMDVSGVFSFQTVEDPPVTTVLIDIGIAKNGILIENSVSVREHVGPAVKSISFYPILVEMRKNDTLTVQVANLSNTLNFKLFGASVRIKQV
jgi:hypothetical protein